MKPKEGDRVQNKKKQSIYGRVTGVSPNGKYISIACTDLRGEFFMNSQPIDEWKKI